MQSQRLSKKILPPFQKKLSVQWISNLFLITKEMTANFLIPVSNQNSVPPVVLNSASSAVQMTDGGCVLIMNPHGVRELTPLHMSATDVLILLTVDIPNNTTVPPKPSRNMNRHCPNPERESTWNRKNFKNSMT